jgi:hypothetical protein
VFEGEVRESSHHAGSNVRRLSGSAGTRSLLEPWYLLWKAGKDCQIDIAVI